MSWSRSETSKSFLTIDWEAAFTGADEQIANRRAAIDALAGDDARPLMILVQSKSDKKVEALLQAALKSERFQLASKWFHCVRVDDSVVDPAHPYASLFAGKKAPRLVLASRKGTKVAPFLRTTSDKLSWSKIAAVLKVDYRDDPTRAVKSIERLLSKFDALDSKRKELNAQLARHTEKKRKSAVRAIEKKLVALEKQKAAVVAAKTKLEALELRSQGKKSKKKS